MRHRLFTIASVVSLLLCVATVVLWVRSYWVDDRVQFGTEPLASTNGFRASMQWELQSCYGSICLERVFYVSYEGIDVVEGVVPEEAHSFLGFGFQQLQWNGWIGLTKDSGILLFSPYWFFALTAAVLPVSLGIGFIRRRRVCRIAAGSCHHCGYNLTGNTSGVCPECGTAINPPGPSGLPISGQTSTDNAAAVTPSPSRSGDSAPGSRTPA